MKFNIFLLSLLFLYTYTIFNRFNWSENQTLGWDAAQYYSYLPAVFIYNDLGRQDFYAGVNEKYKLTPGQNAHAFYEQPQTGKRVCKYAIGLAVMEMPFFLIADTMTKLTHSYLADGYSPYYRLSVCFATVFYTIIGLFYLKKLLQRYFDDDIVLYALVIISLGTNLYHYSVFDMGMSHPFSFCLFAAFFYYVDKWYAAGKNLDLVLSGLLLGLITIVRPINVLVLLPAAFWNTQKITIIWKQLLASQRQRYGWLLALLAFWVILLLQLGYWKYTSGHWVHFSYEEEGFDFQSPKILEGLFSYRKGWFIYTPIAFVALWGLFVLRQQNSHLVLPIILFLVLDVYITFS
ncbi:MAG: hypothetical protein JST52_07755 [Bacteroidetes bacterium]|nr:hypothetical protein [Bacteroidota bacterium]MBS1741047.1 hypothetical protein [Bacteroidota bacterium]